MEIHLYWISAITYAVVLGILLISDIRVSKRPTRLEKSYRVMSAWVVFFCLQDALWGICEAGAIKSDAIFFLSSSIFHMSTVLTTFFWLKYVLDYLGEKVKYKKVYLAIDGLIICAELVLVLVNFFTPTLFEIVDGKYITADYRTLTFANQYIVYLIIGVIALLAALKKGEKYSTNYKTVFFFAIAPILLGICQLLFPDAPFYSLGYFLGCIIIHMFIVANDREAYLSEEEKIRRILELNYELETKQSEIDGQFTITFSNGSHLTPSIVLFTSYVPYLSMSSNGV